MSQSGFDAQTAQHLRMSDCDALRAEIDTRLEQHFGEDAPENRLTCAIRHGLLSPGKRVRPLITLLACCQAGADERNAIDAACAVEMVHAASLIMDDLPSMDDARLRRGCLATHVVFGEGAAGQHTLTFNTFFDDTTVFSESLGNNRGRNSRSDGGASNTEGLDSFTLSLEGRDMERFPGLTYKVGLIHQARGVDGVADEQGVSIALLQNYQTLGGVNWTLIGEVAALENFEGTADDIVYACAWLVYNKGPWTAILSGTYRPRFVADEDDFDDYTIQTSIEFDLGKGFSLALAHEFNRDENADNKRLGFRFSKVIQLGG